MRARIAVACLATGAALAGAGDAPPPLPELRLAPAPPKLAAIPPPPPAMPDFGAPNIPTIGARPALPPLPPTIREAEPPKAAEPPQRYAVTVAAHCVRLPASFRERYGLVAGPSAVVLTEREAKMIDAVIRAEPAKQTICRPHLTVAERQTATLEVTQGGVASGSYRFAVTPETRSRAVHLNVRWRVSGFARAENGEKPGPRPVEIETEVIVPPGGTAVFGQPVVPTEGPDQGKPCELVWVLTAEAAPISATLSP